MSTETLSNEAATEMMAYLNGTQSNVVLGYARQLAGADWAESATVTGINAEGVTVEAVAGNRIETLSVAFPQPAEGPQAVRGMLMQLADEIDPPDGITRSASAFVITPKASRYLKALCNHFNRKGSASYEGDLGRVSFPFGECEMEAKETGLHITVTAPTDTKFSRIKSVIDSHLIRFGGEQEELKVDWVNHVEAA